ncbi:OsmC family peroxiredoxin [Aeromicrobium chenweiae]|uniref:Peroxiredoxin n=1 Tax=Aeromicrobium chenweiae TaxID=2079793 RepID=A0A2S0WNQ0_9ACTN|nr:OsmC family peroxiredoxin [Aeromicrobium chenweiae]AWB92973.1 peroxiredoxin [Aeromicrobium chenweiae]TGN33967.1 OsmC family peroxiredoxin [Aeromicrobium chenweiae]
MPTRTARTAWDGGFEDGSGQVELTDSGLGTFEMSFKKRSSEDGGGATNPEELLGAAHSSCFTMQLTAVLGQKGATPVSIETTAKVTLGEDSADGGFKISKIALKVRGEVEGIDEAGFLEAAEAAKVGCPLSKALASVPEITLDASLETA